MNIEQQHRYTNFRHVSQL